MSSSNVPMPNLSYTDDSSEWVWGSIVTVCAGSSSGPTDLFGLRLVAPRTLRLGYQDRQGLVLGVKEAIDATTACVRHGDVTCFRCVWW